MNIGMKNTAAVVCALITALALGGCASESLHEQPMAGSVSLEEIHEAFTTINYQGKSLPVRSQDDSLQALARVAYTVSDFGSAGNVQPSACPAAAARARDNMRWDNLLAADEDIRVAAQVFLAPNKKSARSLLDNLTQEARACRDVRFTDDAGPVIGESKIVVSALPAGGGNATVSFSSLATTGGKTRAVVTTWRNCGNIVVAVSGTDQESIPADTAAKQDEFAGLLLKKLDCE